MRGKKFEQNLFKSTKKAIALRKISKIFRKSMFPDPLEPFFPQFALPEKHTLINLVPSLKNFEYAFDMRIDVLFRI